MGEMGVTSLDRRRAICRKVTDKVELYFAQQQEPVGRWLKGVEAFAVKHTKEIVEKYKHMKAKRESQVSTPAMSSIDIEITLRTITRRIEATRDTTSPRGAFMNYRGVGMGNSADVWTDVG